VGPGAQPLAAGGLVFFLLTAPANAGILSKYFDCYTKIEIPTERAEGEAGAGPRDPKLDALAGRRRPGFTARDLEEAVEQVNPGAIAPPRPGDFPRDTVGIPDRWRLVETLGLLKSRWQDPYAQNTLKGDRPLCGTHDLFLQLSAISDTVVEPRSFPTPVGVQTTARPGSNDVFGRQHSVVFAQTFILGAALTKGSTAFKPPEFEFRAAIAIQVNHVSVQERRILFVEPSRGTVRTDAFAGVQELFLDYHLRNTSDRYDFDSIRIGIQPFNTDFRGFLFQDNQLGVRLFGNRDNNRFQYNLAVFARLEKDTNSGLNDITSHIRDDWVFAANLYRQDLPVPGLTSQVAVVYNRNREGDRALNDTNGFPVRPALLGDLRGRDYDVVYLGYNADGRIGRLNLTASVWGAFGEDRNSFFTGRPAQIRAFFAAIEPSIDWGWTRVRLSGLYASGDNDPYDDTETGFDAIVENPQFAGSDTSYWIRQTIPFAGGGRAVGVNGRNGILNSLRSSKDQGQSNFNNPGTALIGIGADFELLPELRLTANLNQLWFATTAPLRALRVEGSIPAGIGTDLSGAAILRPKFNQNLVFRLSGALLFPTAGFRDLFANSRRDDRYYSVLFNAVLSY
jgi:hypothetical protein